MPLSDYLPDAQIRAPLGSLTKSAVVQELIDCLPVADESLRESLRAAVDRREHELTTGIGRGVAVPHACTELIDGHLCAFGVAHEPLDFEAIDGEPCRIFFLCLFNPADAAQHLELLSQMARMLNDDAIRGELESAGAPADVRAVFLRQEASAA